MNYMFSILFIIFDMALWGIANSSSADVSPYKCEYFFEKDGAPKEVLVFMENKPGFVVKKCENRNDEANVYYFSISPISRGIKGTCKFSQRSIFEDNEDTSGWSYDPPIGYSYLASDITFMLMPKNYCDKQNSNNYVISDNISEGVFLDIMNFIEIINNAEDKEYILSHFIDINPYGKKFIKFKNDISGNNGDIIVYKISITEDIVNNGFYYYLVEANISNNTWGVALDVFNGNIKILDLMEIEY